MKETLSKVSKSQLAVSMVFVILGILLLVLPGGVTSLLCRLVFGISMMAAGGYYTYDNIQKDEESSLLNLASGVIILIIGVYMFVNSDLVMGLLPALLGAFILVELVWLVKESLTLRGLNNRLWEIGFLFALIFGVMAIILLINPFPNERGMLIFAGWVLILNGVADGIFYFLSMKGKEKGMLPPPVPNPVPLKEEPSEDGVAGKLNSFFGKKQEETGETPAEGTETVEAEVIEAEVVEEAAVPAEEAADTAEKKDWTEEEWNREDGEAAPAAEEAPAEEERKWDPLEDENDIRDWGTPSWADQEDGPGFEIEEVGDAKAGEKPAEDTEKAADEIKVSDEANADVRPLNEADEKA